MPVARSAVARVISAPPAPNWPAWRGVMSANQLASIGGPWSSFGQDPNANAGAGGASIFTYSGGFLVRNGIFVGSTFIPGTFLCVHGGGHTDSNSNEIAAFGPLEATVTMQWWRACLASPVENVNFSGNQPVSTHTYAHLDWLASVNKLIVPVVSGRYSNAGMAAVSALFDFSIASPNNTNAWAQGPTFTQGSTFLEGNCGVYDSRADKYYFVSGNGNTVACVYDVQANTWTRYPSGSGVKNTQISYSDRKCMALDPVTKVSVMTSDVAPAMFDWRSPNGEHYVPTQINAPDFDDDGLGGITFDTLRGRFVWYAGGNVMKVCTPPANPYAGGDAWTWTNVTLTGDTGPAVPSHSGNGIYNRLRYDAARDGFICAAGYNTSVIYVAFS